MRIDIKKLRKFKYQKQNIMFEIEKLKYSFKCLNLDLEILDYKIGMQVIRYYLKTKTLASDFIALDDLKDLLNVKINKFIVNQEIVLELPNPFRQILLYGNTINEEYVSTKPNFEIPLGTSITKEVYKINLKNNNILIHGDRLSGKKNTLNVIITSLLLNEFDLVIDVFDNTNELDYLKNLNILYYNDLDSYEILEHKNHILIFNDLKDFDYLKIIELKKFIDSPFIILSSDINKSKEILEIIDSVILLETKETNNLLNVNSTNLLGKGDSFISNLGRIERVQISLMSNEEIKNLLKEDL